MKALLLSLWVIALASCGGEKPKDETPPLTLDDASNPAKPNEAGNNRKPPSTPDKPEEPAASEPAKPTDNAGAPVEPVIEPRPEEGATDPAEEPEEETQPPATGSGFSNNSLTSFGTRAKFDEYVAHLQTQRANQPQPAPGSVENSAPESSPAETRSDDITNTQEAGVDEGGIVKVSGNYLVSLRRGRLFSIRLQDGEQSTLQLIDTENVNPENHSHEAWYDELLIYNNKIIVVGYSYGYGATEIGEFSLGTDGAITHVRTTFLRSNDYYSSRNYASRLIGNTLVFYMPYYFYQGGAEPVSLPGLATLNANGSRSEWVDIVAPENIIKPIDDEIYPVLHTIVTCDLNAPNFACIGKGVVGPSSRTFYVSPSAVYLWTAKTANSTVYRLPFDGSEVGAALTKGLPTDQFSFKETDDKNLHVLLREEGNGDAMWGPEVREGGVSILNLPLSQFSKEPIQIAATNYLALPEVLGYSLQNRYVGNQLIYGGELLSDHAADTRNPLHIYNLATKKTTTIQVEHAVERIEGLGNNAVVIGSLGNNLVFTSIALSGSYNQIDKYVVEQSAQGEHRSHGYFYKSLSDTNGIVGLPIRASENDWSRPELFVPSAKVIYLSIDQGNFSSLGTLESSATNINDNCEVSCVDWYGNSRPIFWSDRVFALLGYDLVEGSIVDNAIAELRRINFSPAAPAEIVPPAPAQPTAPVTPAG